MIPLSRPRPIAGGLSGRKGRLMKGRLGEKVAGAQRGFGAAANVVPGRMSSGVGKAAGFAAGARARAAQLLKKGPVDLSGAGGGLKA